MEFLTAKEVAERLKISERTAHRWMKTVPHINVSMGDKYEIVRITEDSLEQLVGVMSKDPSALPTRQMVYAIKNDNGAELKKMARR